MSEFRLEVLCKEVGEAYAKDNSAALEIEKRFVSIDKSLMQAVEEMFKKYSTNFFFSLPAKSLFRSFIHNECFLAAFFFFFLAMDPSHCELLLSI